MHGRNGATGELSADRIGYRTTALRLVRAPDAGQSHHDGRHHHHNGETLVHRTLPVNADFDVPNQAPNPLRRSICFLSQFVAGTRCFRGPRFGAFGISGSSTWAGGAVM